MKKTIAKEFLWLVITLLAAVPLSFLFLSCIDIVAKGKTFTQIEKIFILELFLLGFIINFVGIYLTRLIILAFKTITK